jgi:hypothetical protein
VTNTTAAPRSAAHLVPALARTLLKPIEQLVRTGDSAATIDRLFVSRHVGDVRYVVASGVGAVVLVLIFGLLLAFEYQIGDHWKEIHRHSHWYWLHVAFLAAGSFLTVFAPVLVGFCGLVAWAYQVGSVRLGVVDLFACEISTLCRVTTVLETVRHFIGRCEQPSAAKPAVADPPTQPVHPFTSEESYFTVFETSTRDLQTLEAKVVINITAFYTYMKAVRDSLRALSTLQSSYPARSAPSVSESPLRDRQREAIRDLIYLLFLGLESARLAIGDLVEFEPEVAERTAVILISELQAYSYLRSQYTNEHDSHYLRLQLRTDVYRDVVPKLIASIETATASPDSGIARQWEPASRLLNELRELYQKAT